MAAALTDHPNLTIVTNSLVIASAGARQPGMRVFVTGGLLRPHSRELVGLMAEHTLTTVKVAFAVLEADGVSSAAGFTTFDENQARTNQAMAAAARSTIVVASGSRVGRVAVTPMLGCEKVDLLVTDARADPGELDGLRQQGVGTLVVPVE